MIFWILLTFVVIGTIYATFCFVTDEYGLDTTLGKIIATPIALLLCGATGVFLAGIVYVPLGFWADQWSHESDTTSQNLQAIQMGTGTEGLFYLGSGYIRDENVYSFYAKDPDGSYHSERIDADNATIIEDDSVEPHVITHHYDMPWWFGPMDLTETYTIYVPTGSVKPMVNLDLPK